MKVRFKKLSEKATTPSYAKPGDAGLDITAITYLTDPKNDTINYHTGLAIEIPEGYVGLLFPRSSVYKTELSLTNCVGVIDSAAAAWPAWTVGARWKNLQGHHAFVACGFER